MANYTTRLLLLSSVSTAVAIFVLPQSAQAQATTCSQAGTSITCVDGPTPVLTATTSANTTTVPGPGLRTVAAIGPSTTTYVATGPITTTGVSAVTLTSTGGALSFTPSGTTAPVNIRTIGGIGANGLTLSTPGQSATVTVGDIATSGTNSFGVLSTGGTNLTLRTGNITTTGATSTGIDAGAQTGNISITAGNINTTGRGLRIITSNTGTNTIVVGNVVTGDRAILANGGTVSVTTGNVTTSTNGGTTPGGFGVAAQAFTGDSTVRTGAVNTVNGFGIVATAFSATGSANISGCPSVTTTGNNATAVVGQALGTGSVTINCGALTTTGDNSNGVFAISNGGNVLVNITSATTSGVGAFGVTANSSGAGTVTTNAGVITTTGAGSTGLFIDADTGAIDAGYGNITTSGVGNLGGTASAIDIDSTGTINLRGAGATLRTNGAGVTAAIVSGRGVTGNLGNVITTGAGARGAIITSTAPVNLTVGNVATTGNGLTVNAGANTVTLSTGTVTATEAGATGTVINTTGAVSFNGGRQTANGANALRISGGAGAINATVNGAATTGTGTAVAITGSGPLIFANTGSITTTGANSNGINISGVTTASVNCGDVSTTGANSRAVVVAANGTTNVTCGTVSTTGASSDAILVTNSAGTTTVTGGTTSATGAGSAGIVVISSAPAATGLVTVNTGTVTADGNAVVGRSTAGAAVVVNANGNVTSTTRTGILAATGGTTLVTIGAGTTTTGIQGVDLQGVAGNTLIVNGTLRNSGGTTPYTVLAGGPFTLTLGATGTIVGPLTFTTGNDTFNNQGTFALPASLDFLSGNDVLNNTGTLTAFTGTSLISNLETFNNVGGLIDMQDGAANDVVTLANSNYVASGNARLAIDATGTGGAFAADRLVIGGTTSGTTTVLANIVNPVIGSALIVDSTLNNISAGQFALGSATSFGLIDFSAQVRGGDVFLVSAPNAAIFDVATLGTFTQELAYQSLDAHNACAASRRSDFGRTRTAPIGLCAQLYASRDRTGDRTNSATVFGTNLSFSDRMRTERRGSQVELGFSPGGNFEIGATAGYERAETDLASGTDIVADGHNYGVYGQFGTGVGFYAGALAKRDNYRVRFGNGIIIPRVRTDARSTTFDGEVGYRTPGLGAMIDLNAGLTYSRTRMDDFTTGNIAFDNDSNTSLRGRIGARFGWSGDAAPFIDGRVFHEFNGDGETTVRSGLLNDQIELRGRGTWGRIEAGFGGRGLLSAWVDLGDVRGYGARLGFRF